MTEWKTYKLGDICDLVAGFAFKSKDFGNYPDKVVKIADIQPPTVNINDLAGIDLSAYNPSKLQKFIVSKGDYVLAMTGATIGKLGRITNDIEAYINQRVLTFRPNESIVDKDYLYYQLCSVNFSKYILNHIDSETAQPNISAGSVGGFEIALPSLEEQRRIAGILGAIDDKIENNRRINTNLELQAQALYKQWFVDFEFPNKEGKPYKSSGGKMADSELGLIPEGWNAGKLENMGSIVGGGTPSKAIAEYYTENGIAWITPKDLSLTHSKFTSKGEIDITELGYNNSSTKIMPRGSVLFSSRAPIGYISIAKNEICTNQGFKSVIPNNGYTAFVYYYLLANTSNIEAQATGSTFKEASGALMKSLDIVIPNNSLIEEFEGLMSPIFDKQEGLEEENTTLTTLRDTLLPKLMNGEIKM